MLERQDMKNQTPCIKMADEHMTLVTAYTIYSINFQTLAQNSSQYLYKYSHNFFQLLSGSHEDLWSSRCPNYDKLL